MAYTFKLAQGFSVGKSLVERDKVDVAQAALDKAAERNVQFLIPTDNVVAEPTEIDGKFAFGDHRVMMMKISPTTSRAWISAPNPPTPSAR